MRDQISEVILAWKLQRNLLAHDFEAIPGLTTLWPLNAQIMSRTDKLEQSLNRQFLMFLYFAMHVALKS